MGLWGGRRRGLWGHGDLGGGMGVWAGAECLGGGYYGAGGGAGKDSYRLGWALREQHSYDYSYCV